jgi:vitamin K-dependent gamma-carboxylase-like protein
MATEKQPPRMTDASVARKGPLAAAGWARAKLVDLFGADLRSLAAFRIVLALLVLADLGMRATDFYAHYADDGVLPRDQLLEEGLLDSWDFSLSLINGEPFFQALIFAVGAVAALGMLIGYRTRLMTVVAWVILLSIQSRNPMVLNAGDTLLRLLLFWSMFLPLGAYWSVDRALKASPPRLAMRFVSLATVGLFLQIAFMYWFTAILKSGDEWRVDGTALYYALNLDSIVRPLGTYLTQFPELLKVLTFGSLGLEAFGPLLLFFPFFTGPVRTATVLAFMSLHYGIWSTMEIGLFPFTSALCMVCFLPTWFWERADVKLRALFPMLPNLARRLQRATARLVHTYMAPLHTRLSTVGDTIQPFLLAGSVVHGNQPQASATHAATPSANLENKAEPEPTMLRSSLVTNLLAAFFLVYIFCWNLMTVSSFELPESLENVGDALGLGQYWSMFAPSPDSTGGWHVLPGELRGGQQVDLMAVTRDDYEPYALSWAKPQYVAGIYESNHWRKYMDRLAEEEYEDLRLHFGNYVCTEWNKRHAGSEQLASFDIVYMEEETQPTNRRVTPDKMVVYEHSCD